jgi:YVTN family beta-propeller protein
MNRPTQSRLVWQRHAWLLLAGLAGTYARAQSAVATIPTTQYPVAIAVNPVTNKIYVANSDANGVVTVIDGATNATTSVAVGTNPAGIAVNTVTNKIYVSNEYGNSVSVIDGTTNVVTATVPVGVNPSAIAVNTTTNKIYVINTAVSQNLFGSVTEIDGVSNATVNNIAFGISPGIRGLGPGAIAVDSVRNKVFASDYANGNVAEIDGSTHAVTSITQTNPTWIAVNPAAGKAYIANGNHSSVTIVDEATGDIAAVDVLGAFFNSVAVNTRTNAAYAASSDYIVVANGPIATDDVAVIDGSANTLSAGINGGPSASVVAVDSATNKIFVVDATGNQVTVIDGATNTPTAVPTGSGPFMVVVNPTTNLAYVMDNDAQGTVTVVAETGAAVPTFTAEPQSQTVNSGSPVVFSATESGGTPTFQWSFNGSPLSDGNGISGSATATLFISEGATAANAGSYTCEATTAGGSATSAVATLTVTNSPTPGRLINISTTAYVSTGSNILIAGFTVGGTGSKAMILRGVGPTLASGFNVAGTLAAPVLSLYDSANPPDLITADSGWQNTPQVPSGPWSGRAMPLDATTSDFTQVGAFALATGSADSAIKITLPSGGYTSQITGANNGEGVALAEVYDADTGTQTSEIVNISARAFIAPPSVPFNLAIAGFVISGSTSETVLIRVSGPALAAFGVQGTLPDPQVRLFDNNQVVIASNYGWAGSPQIAKAASSVGAFAWNDPSSPDSAVLITLPPGAYTAQATTQSIESGVTLLEVYAVK